MSFLSAEEESKAGNGTVVDCSGDDVGAFCRKKVCKC